MLLIVCEASAQPMLRCRTFRSGVEMLHSRVCCMDQDEDGMLWFGTWVGLCRYDGVQFRYFRADAESSVPLVTNRVSQLAADGHGHVWCATHDGNLFCFDKVQARFSEVLPFVQKQSGYQLSVNPESGSCIYPIPSKNVTWVVLSDGRCVRFDNKNLDSNCIWPETSSAISRHIFDICCDSQGREWILSDQGSFLYGEKNVSDYPFSALREIGGRVFLSANGGYLAEYVNGAVRFLNIPRTIKKIDHMTAVGDSILCLSTNVGVAIVSLTDSLRFCSTTVDGEELSNLSQSEIAEDGILWTFTKTGVIYRIDLKDKDMPAVKCSDYPRFVQPDDNVSNLVYTDAYGTTWVKPRDGALLWWDEVTGRLRASEDVTSQGEHPQFGEADRFFVDSQRNLWKYGTSETYEMNSARRQSRFIPIPELQEVRSLMYDDSLHVWFGDRSNGLLGRLNLSDGSRQYLTPQGKWSSKPQSFSQSAIYCIMRDSEGLVWVGTYGDGLYRLLPQGSTLESGFHVIHHLSRGGTFDVSSDYVTCVYEDERRHVWVGTDGGGLNLVDRRFSNDIRFLQSRSKLLNYPKTGHMSVGSIVSNGQNTLLLATYNGIVSFPSGFQRPAEIDFHTHARRPQEQNALPENVVMQMLCSNDGKLYACTFGNGASRILSDSLLSDSLQFETYVSKIPQPGDMTIAAQIDSMGRVWTVSECAFRCYDPSSGQMRYFDCEDLGENHVYTDGRPLYMPSGKMLLCARGGILMFDTDSISKTAFSPSIAITDVVMQPGGNSVSLRFPALDFSSSSGCICYAYRLDDDDSEWQYTCQPEVKLNNLSGGRHRLYVRSTNSAGVWCDNERVWEFAIPVPFWKHPFMLCVYLALLIVTGYIIYKYVNVRIAEIRSLVEEKHRRALRLQSEEYEDKMAASEKSLSEEYEHRIEQMQSQFDEQLERVRSSAYVQGRDSVLLNMAGKSRDEESETADASNTAEDTERDAISESDKLFLQRVEKYLEHNLSNSDLAMQDLVDATATSRTIFYKRLKSLTGLSPVDYVRRLRIETSKSLLLMSQDSLSIIAYKVGFSDPKYFSKCFRTQVGMSPLEYRHANSSSSKDDDSTAK